MSHNRFHVIFHLYDVTDDCHGVTTKSAFYIHVQMKCPIFRDSLITIRHMVTNLYMQMCQGNVTMLVDKSDDVIDYKPRFVFLAPECHSCRFSFPHITRPPASILEFLPYWFSIWSRQNIYLNFVSLQRSVSLLFLDKSSKYTCKFIST